MNIAIYHNLPIGGAREVIDNLSIEFKKCGMVVDLFTIQNNVNKANFTNTTIIPWPYIISNPIDEIYRCILTLPRINKDIATIINSKKYDLIIIGQCLFTQSPHILKYLSGVNNVVYLLNEPKREFYEKTSYEHHSVKKMIARLLRLPLKIIDTQNASFAKTIVSNSIYSYFRILKIYNKKSYVVYPGMKHVKTSIHYKKLNHHINTLSVGLLSMIKGHDFSLKMISNKLNNFTLLGRSTNENELIMEIARKNNINIRYINNPSSKYIKKEYLKSDIFLANNVNEPFGITTLEATTNKLFTLGKNQAGTPEIILHGINGYLNPNDLMMATKIFNHYGSQNVIKKVKISKIDWNNYANTILKISRTPNE